MCISSPPFWKERDTLSHRKQLWGSTGVTQIYITSETMKFPQSSQSLWGNRCRVKWQWSPTYLTITSSPPSIPLTNPRPDIVADDIQAKTAIILELTVCFETNFEDARKRKEEKYCELVEEVIENGFVMDFVTCFGAINAVRPSCPWYNYYKCMGIFSVLNCVC